MANSIILPHHRLRVAQAAMALLVAIRDANIADAHWKREALHSGGSCVANIVEAAGKVTLADKKRIFAIARGEALEAVAHVEIASVLGAVTPDALDRVQLTAEPVVAMLTALVRR